MSQISASRGTSAAAVKADPEHPEDQSSRGAPLHRQFAEVRVFGLVHHLALARHEAPTAILALAPPIQMIIAQSRRVDPFCRLDVEFPRCQRASRATILACRAHHPDHLEEEPAAGPSLTRL